MVTSVDKFFISLKDQFLHHFKVPTFNTVKTIKTKTPVDFVPTKSKKAKQQVKQRDKGSFENCVKPFSGCFWQLFFLEFLRIRKNIKPSCRSQSTSSFDFFFYFTFEKCTFSKGFQIWLNWSTYHSWIFKTTFRFENRFLK